jgi:BirA family biotin operon repressor/biotin-[acetyl-CoA-carboxylase] ligase
MPDHDSTDSRAPTEGPARREVTAGPWAAGDVIYLGNVDSTNRYALDAARSGRSGGFVVVCDHQSAGRGRRGRRWIEPGGGSLLCSVLFRSRLTIDECTLLTFVVANAAVDAIAKTTGVTGSLKWPNDILIAERKVAGILAEVGHEYPDGATAVVVGIGINLAFPRGWLETASGDEGRAIAERATTLEEATGVRPTRDAVLEAFLGALDARVGHEPTAASLPSILAESRARMATIGRIVQIEDGSGARTGRAVGITDAGRLEVDIDGVTTVLNAADVTHLR